MNHGGKNPHGPGLGIDPGGTWKGAAKGCKHAIFLTVGTGIGAGLGRMAEEMQNPAPMTAADFFTAFREGNPLTKKVIIQAIRFWGKAGANLVSLFNPEKIIFGGGVFGPATQFLEEIYHEAKKWAQPVGIQNATEI